MIIDKAWGFEDIFHNDKDYCGKLLHVNEGWTCSLHYHIDKKETFRVISGCMRVILMHKDKPAEVFWVYPGDTIEVPPFLSHAFGIPAGDGQFYSAIHQLQYNGFCEFIEVSTQHKDSDSFRLIPSGKI